MDGRRTTSNSNYRRDISSPSALICAVVPGWFGGTHVPVSNFTLKFFAPLLLCVFALNFRVFGI